MSQIQLAIQANSQPADGKSAVTVQATVTDANNAPVAGAVVNFSATAGTLAQAQATTDANGQAVASLTNTTPGPVTLLPWTRPQTSTNLLWIRWVSISELAALQ